MHQVLQEMQGPSTQVCCIVLVGYIIYCVDPKEGKKLKQNMLRYPTGYSVNGAGSVAGYRFGNKFDFEQLEKNNHACF